MFFPFMDNDPDSSQVEAFHLLLIEASLQAMLLEYREDLLETGEFEALLQELAWDGALPFTRDLVGEGLFREHVGANAASVHRYLELHDPEEDLSAYYPYEEKLVQILEDQGNAELWECYGAALDQAIEEDEDD
jgi:hypothetical protein